MQDWAPPPPQPKVIINSILMPLEVYFGVKYDKIKY